MEEEKKRNLLKILGIITITFIAAFLAFYAAILITFNKMSNPNREMKNIEKFVEMYNKDFQKIEDKLSEHPFVPKSRPMLVNLVKENNEYNIIIDLKQLQGNTQGIDVKISNNIVTVYGEINNETLRGEEMLNFSQSYYLDEDLDTGKISKEKRGEKYIITIPFKD